MRSTSSGSRALAALLSTILVVTGGAVPCAQGEGAPEPCLLLKIASRGIPVPVAREALAPFPKLLEERLAIRWVPPASAEEKSPKAEVANLFPEPSPAVLGEISRDLEEASRRMDEMETAAAERLLRDAERRSRQVRFGPVIRPYLAEIFYRQGILFLWNGEDDRCIERFSRSRALRPEFSPEPALYSPAVREAWERSGEHPATTADLLVQSMPPGGEIFLDGRRAGVTPGKVSISPAGPVRIRVELEGYRAEERISQWLPGDSAMVEFSLDRDPVADLPGVLDADPEGVSTGRLLAGMARQAGAIRVAVLAYEAREGQPTPVLRVLSLNLEDSRAKVLGEVPWVSGEGSIERIVEQAATILANAGWPTKTPSRKRSRPWYHTWWFWTVMVTVVAGVAAAGAGGGGGSSGSSTGTIGVTF